jgi:hypothetical protein
LLNRTRPVVSHTVVPMAPIRPGYPPGPVNSVGNMGILIFHRDNNLNILLS